MAGWDSVIEHNAASELTAARLISQLRACEASALAFWLPRNAKYESARSSKSITRSHSSQRQIGGSCGAAVASGHVAP